MLAADVALPLAVFYGLRAAGVNQWLALVLGSVTPAVRLAVTALRASRVELMGLFTLSLLAIGTAIGMVTADARLLVARESYLTGVVGLWILATLLARRPMLFEATVRFMPEAAAQQWQRD